MIGSLPPLVGLSPYTRALVDALSRYWPIEFLGFSNIYPRFLYPGRLKDDSQLPLEEHENLRIRNVLNWYNPFQWVAEGLRIHSPLVHAQWWSFPLAPIYYTLLSLSRMRGKRVIMTVHNVRPHERQGMKTFFNRSVFGLADEFIVHTNSNRETLSRFVGGRPIHVIPHGIITIKRKGLSREEARRILGWALQERILLCFGHIRPYKGVDVAIKALAHIPDCNVRLVIAGRPWEDWTRYQKLIHDLRLENRIHLLLDYIPSEQVEAVFAASDLVLLPYKSFDAQSGVGALVLSFQIPLVVAETGGLPDYVKDPKCCFPPGNDLELAQRIEEILNSPRLYTKLSREVGQMRNELSWDRIARKTAALYRSLLGRTED